MRPRDVEEPTGAALRVRLQQIVIDSREPSRLVRFWAALLGGEPVDRADGWAYVEPPGFPALTFQLVPEAKAGKNRLHLDLEVDAGEISAAVARAAELGATPVGAVVTDESGRFHVMTDPDGNEFCFVSD
jgi:catechol 2,3-dioxygenase-like lactoylglutathione lyase family enzyme